MLLLGSHIYIRSEMNFHHEMKIHFRFFLSHDDSEIYQYFMKKDMYFEKIPSENRPDVSCFTDVIMLLLMTSTDCELYTDKVKSGINNTHKAYEYINKEFDHFKMDHTTFNKSIKEKFHSNEIKKVNQIKRREMDSKLDFYCNI